MINSDICSIISTHDLTKRSTYISGDNGNLGIFQLTTSRRGRLFAISFPLVVLYFNSRPHEEVDLIGYRLIPDCYISTHDLTKRSTLKGNFCVMNSAFQLTTSRRGRPLVVLYKAYVPVYFNSRPHEEVDLE